jgi:hypothetical protein
VPAGTNLTVHNGDFHADQAGATVSDLLITGGLIVEAPNVTVERVRVATGDGYFGIRQLPGAVNLTVRDSEVIGQPLQFGVGQQERGLTLTRVLIRNVETGVSLGGGSVTITGSRIDGLVNANGYGIASQGNTPDLVIRGNVVIQPGAGGGAIGLLVDAGPYANVTIESNTFAGGAWTLRAGKAAGSHDIRVRDNRFSREIFPNCGSYAPVLEWDGAEPGNVWSGNIWADTGEAVNP